MSPSSPIDRELRRWLRNHYGVIGYSEARRLGATPTTIRSKVRRGEWARMYQGVYRDTATARGPNQDLRAAFVALEGFGVVSHASAAWVWKLLPRPPDKPELSVVLGTRNARLDRGFVLHRSRDLDMSEAVSTNGVLVTNPRRTMVDLAGTVGPAQLTEAVDNALARKLVTTAGLQAEIDRLSRRGRDGVAILRHHLLDRGFVGAPEPSVLEAHTRRLILRTGLPIPVVEYHAGPDGEYRLDFAWAEILLAVEVDGYAWHFSVEHKRSDDTRRNRLQAAGWTVLVYSWTEIVREPIRVVEEIQANHSQLTRSR